MSDEPKDRLLKLSEAAEMLGIPAISLWRRCRQSAIAHVRLGRTYYLSLATVQGLLDSAGASAQEPAR